MNRLAWVTIIAVVLAVLSVVLAFTDVVTDSEAVLGLGLALVLAVAGLKEQ